MAMKAKHAFGSSSGLESAIQSGKVDSFDILFLDGDTDNPKIGWIDKNGNPVILKDEKADLSEVESDIKALESEMATKANAEEVEAKISEKADASDVESLESQIATKVDATTVKTMIEEHTKSVIEVVEF